MKLLTTLVLSVSSMSAQPFSLACVSGATRCIKSQGTEIPSEILDNCADLTQNDIGRVVLRISQQEMLQRTGGKVTPLSRAWFAFDYLYESPLVFERKAKAEDTKYQQIKRSCQALERDFNDDSKWTK